MNNFVKENPNQNIGREFMWLGEYLNGTLQKEIDLKNGTMNEFNQIDKTNLLRFGLVGSGHHIFFDTVTGAFNLAGQEITFEYRVGNKVVPLTNQDIRYNDVIQFKNVHSNANFDGSGYSKSVIDKYNIGYKSEFYNEGVRFNFKPILHVPMNQKTHFSIWLVSDKDLNGQIVIKRNGFKIEEFECPLEENRGGTLNWIVSI